MADYNLDALFISLQPYLQILPQSPVDIAQQIIRAVRQGQDEHEITDALAKKGLRFLDSDVLDCLRDSVSPDTIANIQRKLSEIEDNRSIHLSNDTRRVILDRFFPRTPIYQTDERLKGRSAGKTAEIAYGIADPEQRNFYSWCIAISHDTVISNYFGCFFTAYTKASRHIREQFVGLFEHSAEPVLAEMTGRCASYLKEKHIDSWPEDKLLNFRNTLIRVGTKTIDRLKDLSEGRSDSAMFPQTSKDVSAAYYKDSIEHKIREYGDAAALARIIATTGVVVNSVPTGKFALQEETVCRIWGWDLQKSDHEWHKRMLEAIRAFEDGDHHRAWTLFDSAVRLHGTSASDKEDARMFADMLCYQAHLMMLKGYGVAADEGLIESDHQSKSFRAAHAKMKEAWRLAAQFGEPNAKPLPYSARSYYEYAFFVFQRPQSAPDANETEIKNAKICLKNAIQLGCVDAVLLKAQLRINGAPGCNKNPAAGIELLQNDERFANATKLQKRERISLLAAYYAGSEDQALAEHYCEEAAQLGSYEATAYLRRKNMKPDDSPQVALSAPDQGKICLFNSDVAANADRSSLNAVLYASLPRDLWDADGSADFSSLTRDLRFLRYGQIVFSLLSEDENRNLSDAIELIRLLNGIAAQQTPDARDALIDRIDVYLLNTSTACPLLLDAAMGNLEENVYFRVHVCDPDLFAVNELLTRCPTFLPCISPATGELRTENWEGKGLYQRCRRRVVIIGTDRSAEVLLKQILAVTFLENYPTELTVVGKDADALEERFREDCPGLDPTVDRYTGSAILPAFYAHDPSALPLNRPCDGPEAALQRILRSADYFIVTGADDCENLALGVKLRRSLIRRDPDPDRRPFIAVRYRDHRSAWIASQVAVSSRNYTAKSGWSSRYHWTEDYDLHLFGSSAAFESGQLFSNRIEDQALQLHKSYYGNTHADSKAAT
ncbi:MAG: hypothetical protein ACI4XW_12960, partial [Candidatus Spyradocola sp.]